MFFMHLFAFQWKGQKVWQKVWQRVGQKVCLATVLFFCLNVFATQAVVLPNAQASLVEIEFASHHFTVAEDGSYRVVVEHRERLLNEAAVKERSAHLLTYFRTHRRAVDGIEIFEAYVLKPDGSRLVPITDPARPSQEVQFTGAVAGDALVIKYRLHKARPLFRAQFEDFLVLERFAYKEFLVRYDMPGSRKLYAEMRGFVAEPVRTELERTSYVWRYQASARPLPEAGAVAYSDNGDFLAVSTFENYASLAQAYRFESVGADQSSAKIKALARTILDSAPAGASTLERALAIGRWVQENIKYSSVTVASSPIRPTPADQVLQMGYADCKGHVALIAALAAELGVDGAPALVNVTNAYRLGKVPTLGVLNHVVFYIPDLALVIDATAKATPVGAVPALIAGKSAVLVQNGEKNGQTVNLAFDAQPSLAVETLLTVGNDGSALLTQTSTQTYANALAWSAAQYSMSRIKMDSRADSKRAETALLVQGLVAKVLDIEVKIDSVKREIQTRTSASLAAYLRRGKTVLFPVDALEDGLLPLAFAGVVDAGRQQPYPCRAASKTVVNTRIVLPEGVVISSPPGKEEITLDAMKLSGNLAVESGSVAMLRTLEVRQPSATCQPKVTPASQAQLSDFVRVARPYVSIHW